MIFGTLNLTADGNKSWYGNAGPVAMDQDLKEMQVCADESYTCNWSCLWRFVSAALIAEEASCILEGCLFSSERSNGKRSKKELAAHQVPVSAHSFGS